MAGNPLSPSFRFLANIGEGDAHPDIVKALRQHNNNIVDLNQAIVALKGQVDTKNGVGGGSPVVEGGGSITVINNNTSAFPGLGAVNNQSGSTAYTVMSTDSGALVLVDDASPIAVTLDSSLTTPYFTTVSNTGTSTATLTPTTGTINGSASLTLPGGSWVTVYYDGINWQADSPGGTAGGVSQLVAGANITLTPPGGVGIVAVAASGTFSLNRLPHNVTGSRAFGTNYQNTTGGEMWVSGYGTTNGGSTDTMTMFIGTVNPATIAICGISPTATIIGGQVPFSFPVPDTYWYRVLVGGSAITGLGAWFEFY